MNDNTLVHGIAHVNIPCGPLFSIYCRGGYINIAAVEQVNIATFQEKKIMEATGNSVLRAYDKAVKAIMKDKYMDSACRDAGFIVPIGQKRGYKRGYQVFIVVYKWDEQLLKEQLLTGGLYYHLRKWTLRWRNACRVGPVTK